MTRRLLIFLICWTATILSCNTLSLPSEDSQDERTETPALAETELAALKATMTEMIKSPTPTTEPAGPVEINWFIGLNGEPVAEQKQLINEFIKQFNSENGDRYKLKVQFAPAEQAFERLASLIASGNAPDIVGPAGVFSIGRFPGAWLDLTDLIESNQTDLSDFDPAVVNTYRSEADGLISLPFSIYPSALWYNKKLFDSSGIAYPPHRWEEDYRGKQWDFSALREIAMQLTQDKNHRTASQSGFNPDSISQFGFFTQWTTLRGQWTFMGADTFIDNKENAVIPEIWRKAAHWYYEGMWQDHFIPTASDNSSNEFGGGNMFSSEKLAMMPQNFWYTCCVGSVDWDVAAMPSFEGNRPVSKLHADSFVIPKESRNPQAAFEVLTLFVDRYAEDLLSAFGVFDFGLPGRRSLQAQALDGYAARFPAVDFQVFLDAQEFTDFPNHESGLPNLPDAQNVYEVFHSKYESDGTLDLDAELDQLRLDLQAVFDN